MSEVVLLLLLRFPFISLIDLSMSSLNTDDLNQTKTVDLELYTRDKHRVRSRSRRYIFKVNYRSFIEEMMASRCIKRSNVILHT